MITQQPFSYLPDDDRPEGCDPSAIGSQWLVPVALARRAAPGQGRASATRYELLRAEALHLEPGEGTLVVNAGGSGVYRLRYDDVLLADILANFGRLEPLERFKHVADTWACALAGSTPLEQFLGLVRRLEAETEPSVWAMVVGALTILDLAIAEEDRVVLQAFVQSLLGPELRVGFDPSARDDTEAPRRRAVLIGALGILGADPEVRAECRTRFAGLQGGATLEADTASAILHVVATCAGRFEYEALLPVSARRPTRSKEQRYLDSLSYISDPKLVAEICELCLSEIRTQDAPYLLRKLLISRLVGPQVWTFVAGHWDRLLGCTRRTPSRA